MTLVHRAYARVKRGELDNVLEIAREGAKRFPESTVIRHYSADIGQPRNTFVFEVEFADYAEYEEVWRAWTALEETPELMDRWNALVEEMRHELWELHELPD